jgi:hypothetical protein
LQGTHAILELKQGRDSAAMARVRRQHRITSTDEEVLAMVAQVAWLTGAPDGDSLILVRYQAAPDARPFAAVPYTYRTLVAATRLRQGKALAARALIDSALTVARGECDRGGEDPGPAVELSALFALSGRKRDPMDWLERAHQVGYRDYRWPPRDPFLRTLADDPRFTRLLTQMEAEVTVMRRRAAAANDSLFRAAKGRAQGRRPPAVRCRSTRCCQITVAPSSRRLVIRMAVASTLICGGKAARRAP